MEGREARSFGPIDRGSVLQQQPDHLAVPARGCAVERPHAEVVVTDGIDLGAPIEEKADGLRMPEERSEVERCEAIRRDRCW